MRKASDRRLKDSEESAEACALRLFRQAMDALRAMPQPYHVYVASGTACLMRGPTHAGDGRHALHENVVDHDGGIRIDGGDW